MNDHDNDEAARAAWLYHLGGYTQGQIAKRLGLSRVKVNRLIAAAHERRLLTISLNHRLEPCLVLEEAIVRLYGIASCIVVPRLGDLGDPDETTHVHTVLGHAGAQFLGNHLRSESLSILGIGWGRTLASAVDHLGKIQRPDLKIVSLLGSLTRFSATNPFDVVHRLSARTGGIGYFLPVPFLADTANDAAVLRQQKVVNDIWNLAGHADLYVIGVGALSQYGRFDQQGLLHRDDIAALYKAGAIGDILGSFIDRDGNLVDCDANDRAMGYSLERLRGKEVVAIAGGSSKADIIAASLKSGLISTLIVDEDTAELVQQLA